MENKDKKSKWYVRIDGQLIDDRPFDNPYEAKHYAQHIKTQFYALTRCSSETTVPEVEIVNLELT